MANKRGQTLDYWTLLNSEQLLLNRFFDPSTPSMRKGCNGEKRFENGEKNYGENSGPLTSLPVNRPTTTDRNADLLCQKHGLKH